MLRPFALGAVVFSICSAAIAGAADEAEAAFAKFFPAFAAYNQNAVAAMFAPDGQFYGTLSPRLVTNAEGVQSYFNAALNRPDRVVATSLQLTSKELSDDIVLIAGQWKVDRMLNDKTVSGGPYRVTAVMQKRNGAWTVVQFHNSPVPVPPAPQPAASR